MPQCQEPMRSFNPLKKVSQIWREIRQAWAVADDLRSRLQLVADVVLYRILRFLKLPPSERHVMLAGGVSVSYRLNRGDIQSIREIWFTEDYKLPFTIVPRIIVDLGANIGMTSLWYSRRYDCVRVIAVEPSPDNVRLLKKNFSDNGIEAEVVEAAIGVKEGEANFVRTRESNLGMISRHASPGSIRVKGISMATILRMVADLGLDAIDLLKVDIEGSEAELFSDGLEWLDHVNAIAIEFHADRVDYPGLVSRLTAAGLRYFPPNSVFERHIDSFVHDPLGAVKPGA